MLSVPLYNRMTNGDCSSGPIGRHAPQNYAVFDVLPRYGAFASSPGAGEVTDVNGGYFID